MVQAKFRISVAITALILPVFAFALSGCGPDPTERYLDFAQCLTDKGVVMYGSYRCSHCANVKKMFGASFKNITYIECDPTSSKYKKEICEKKQLQGYPTWEFADGSTQLGEMTFEQLAAKSGCQLM